MSSKAKPNPLPLSDTLRDLALLRAADCDLSSALPPPITSNQSAASLEEGTVYESVERSYEFVREARAVMRLLGREEVEKQGARLEEVRSGLEDVLHGLEGQ
ncbi:uncharacterized protein LAESUDRAFT_727805 [Laetiporus sulphureus 93-53]|uniref:Uncharacterized protein n=1 Tax=Laetiporus sulphureus 93-53 TaxID=1314785 RepID=A0A165DDG9_9APHY|nr:uncharacterized protein LAESUDRAFT_727805 [Laetiporus sulphureus 93-53]KZT04631.1 hypothetical protein LAESUDRAFT_727805 [Laetiporus sulphureus 93-53]